MPLQHNENISESGQQTVKNFDSIKMLNKTYAESLRNEKKTLNFIFAGLSIQRQNGRFSFKSSISK